MFYQARFLNNCVCNKRTHLGHFHGKIFLLIPSWQVLGVSKFWTYIKLTELEVDFLMPLYFCLRGSISHFKVEFARIKFKQWNCVVASVLLVSLTPLGITLRVILPPLTCLVTPFWWSKTTMGGSSLNGQFLYVIPGWSSILIKEGLWNCCIVQGLCLQHFR